VYCLLTGTKFFRDTDTSSIGCTKSAEVPISVETSLPPPGIRTAHLSPSLSTIRSMSSSARRADPPLRSLTPSLLACNTNDRRNRHNRAAENPVQRRVHTKPCIASNYETAIRVIFGLPGPLSGPKTLVSFIAWLSRKRYHAIGLQDNLTMGVICTVCSFALMGICSCTEGAPHAYPLIFNGTPFGQMDDILRWPLKAYCMKVGPILLQVVIVQPGFFHHGIAATPKASS